MTEDRAVHVAFLRAVNVGGRGVLRMEDLRQAFERAGAVAVRTFIQSGNVAFECRRDAIAGVLDKARNALRRRLGAEPGITMRTAADLERALSADRFGPLGQDRTVKLYVALLFAAPRARLRLPLASAAEALEMVAVEGREAYVVSRRKPNGFYGFPNNFVEQVLGVPATTRNISTLTKIAAAIGAEAPRRPA